jgi:hypothetical protein
MVMLVGTIFIILLLVLVLLVGGTALCLFLYVLFFNDCKDRALIDINQIFKDEIMVELLPDHAQQLRFELLKFDKFIIEVDALWHCQVFNFVRITPEKQTRNVEDNANTIVIILIKVQQVES